MRLVRAIAAMLAVFTAAQGLAQTGRDAATVLGRDLVTEPVLRDRPAIMVPQATAVQREVEPPRSDALIVGAISIEGAPAIGRETFAAVIERFIGKPADARELQAIARAVADAVRERGYIFASAIVPEQVVDTGTITVQIDAGAVDRVTVVGSANAALKRTLDQIVGRAVRRDLFERQLLLAGDTPGITVLSTRYVRTVDGATLVVDVREDRRSGSAVLDNSGSHALGPARARVRLDLTGLLDDGDQFVTQLVVTPLEPKELAYASARYTIGIGTAGTQLGAALAAGKTRPGGMLFAGRSRGQSRYGSIFVNHPVVRTNRSSMWINAELAYLEVDQQFTGFQPQHDAIATLAVSVTGNTRFAGSRLWGGFSVVQGLNLAGTTRAGSQTSSREDGSGQFTKAVAWVNWTGALNKQLSVRVAGTGQLATRPLLAAQEIGVGGSGFGRAYDFGERFGDGGFLGLVELRARFDEIAPAIDWLQIYHFVDGGYVDNLAAGFGDGTRLSAGSGLRMAIGKTNVGVELAFPLNAPRADTGRYTPRLNLTVGHDF